MALRHSANRRKSQQDPNAVQRDATFGPFGGFVPNTVQPTGLGVDPGLITMGTAASMTGLIPRGEDLGPDYGWTRFQPDPAIPQLPLGGYGAGSPAAVTAPVVHLVRLHNDVSPNNQHENLAVTCKVGAVGGTIYQYPKFDTTTAWTEMQSLRNSADAVIAPNDDILTTIHEVWDSAIYLPGHTVILVDGAGTNYTSQQSGQVRYYTGKKWGAFPPPPGVVTHAAATVCAYKERVLVGNTKEDTVFHQNRVRWTTAGWSTTQTSPITLPSATSLWDDPGSGALDFEEHTGAIVAIRECGPRIAVYSEQGCSFLDLTGLYTRPYQRTVVTTSRGLVGTRAVVNLGGGVHFGIFTDGWFLFDYQGQFKEVGTVSIQGTTVRKWAQVFYELLNDIYAYMTHLYYDPSRHFIYICFPVGKDATTPNAVWIYDIYGDRLFPDGYLLGGGDYSPLCWCDLVEYIKAGVPIDSLDQPIDDYNVPIDSWGPAFSGRFLPNHGTASGLVMQHDPLIYTRDGQVTPWNYATHPNALNDPSQWKELEQFILHYIKTGTAGTVGFGLYDGKTGGLVDQITLQIDGSGALRPDSVNAWLRRTMVQYQLVLQGTHPFILRGFELQWIPNMGDTRF